MLVSFQTHLTCSLKPVLKLANKYIQERDLKLIVLQDAPQGVSLLSSVSRNISSKAIALFSLEESKKESIGSDPKMPTILRITIGRLSFKKVSSLKLSATFPALILKKTASTMSWDD